MNKALESLALPLVSASPPSIPRAVEIEKAAESHGGSRKPVEARFKELTWSLAESGVSDVSA